MTRGENDLFYKFLKMKSPKFHGTKSEYAYEFIIDYHESFHKLVVVERYGVGFVSFSVAGGCQDVVEGIH